MKRLVLFTGLILIGYGCVSKDEYKTDLSFYGFSIGEHVDDSEVNMSNRKIAFDRYEEWTKKVLDGASTKDFFMSGSKCREMQRDESTKTSIVICLIKEPGDIEEIRLVYVSDYLVKMEINFKDTKMEILKNKLTSHFSKPLELIENSQYEKLSATSGPFKLAFPVFTETCFSGCHYYSIQIKKGGVGGYVREGHKNSPEMVIGDIANTVKIIKVAQGEKDKNSKENDEQNKKSTSW